MAKRYRAGFPDLNETGQGSPRGDRVGGGFYTFVVRDSQARWTGVRIGHQAEASRAGRSFYVAGVGRLQLAKCAVIGSRGSGRLLPLGTSPPAGGEEGRPIMAPGPALPTAFVMLFLPCKIRSIHSISKALNPTSSNGQIYSLEMLCRHSI